MRSNLARIATETHGHRGMIVLGACLILIGTASSLLYPPIIGKVMDLAIQGAPGQISTISWLCAMLTVALFSWAAFSSFGSYLLDKKGILIVNRLKERIFVKLIKNDYQYFSGQKTGDLVSRIQVDTDTIRNAVTHTVASILNHVFMFIGAIILMLLMDWKLTLLMLLLAPISAIVSMHFGPRISDSSRLAHDSVGNSGAIVSETLTGIQTVKAFGLESQIERNFSNAVKSSIKNAIKVIRLNSIFGATMHFSVTLTAIGIFWYGGMKVINGHMSGGTLITFLFYSESLTQGFLTLSVMYGQIAKAVGASSRVFDILNIDSSRQEQKTCKKEFCEKQRMDIVIVHDIGFSYTTGNRVLSNINFSIGKNEVVGLIGQSGCGKSTLANILGGLYRASCGHITLNDETAEKMSVENSRPAVILVPQDTFIFNDSIFNNIHMVAPDASKRDVMQAAELSCVTEFTNKLPSGLKTLVGERGSRLSGGQRQRIGLARALLMKPKLLILDEATSALDTETEMHVFEGITKMKRGAPMSVILITHRTSALQHADSILKMDNGRIIWSGSRMDYFNKHNEIISANQPVFNMTSAA